MLQKKKNSHPKTRMAIHFALISVQKNPMQAYREASSHHDIYG